MRHLKFKSVKGLVQVSLIGSLLLTLTTLIVSCSKDDNLPKQYLLRGTWQLYKTTSGATETTYQLSAQNQLIFTPQILERYSAGVQTDSTHYQIKVTQDSPEALIGQLFMDPANPIGLLIKGDTLTLSPPGVILSTLSYIKTK